MAHYDQSAAALARRDFLKRFFHDLATPLSAVSLHIEGADRRARKGADPSEALAVAKTELGKAFDLFELGRQSLLEDPGPAESVDFDAVVREAAAGFPGTRVEGSTGGRVRAPRSRVVSALNALIVNAVEASNAESVRIALERRAGRLRAAVMNPGELSTDNPETLFSPKASREGRTWGMGLSRARLAAADGGGTVTLANLDGRVIATFDLPEEMS